MSLSNYHDPEDEMSLGSEYPGLTDQDFEAIRCVIEERERQTSLWEQDVDDEYYPADWGQLIIKYLGHALDPQTSMEVYHDGLVKVGALVVAALSAYYRSPDEEEEVVVGG